MRMVGNYDLVRIYAIGHGVPPLGVPNISRHIPKESPNKHPPNYHGGGPLVLNRLFNSRHSTFNSFYRVHDIIRMFFKIVSVYVLTIHTTLPTSVFFG